MGWAEHIPKLWFHAIFHAAAGLTFVVAAKCAQPIALILSTFVRTRDAASPRIEGADQACWLFAKICRRCSFDLVAVLRRSSLLHHSNSNSHSARSLLLLVVVQTGYRVARIDSIDRCSGNGSTDDCCCDAEVPDPEMGREASQESTLDAPLLEPREDGQTDRDLALVLAMR